MRLHAPLSLLLVLAVGCDESGPGPNSDPNVDPDNPVPDSGFVSYPDSGTWIPDGGQPFVDSGFFPPPPDSGVNPPPDAGVNPPPDSGVPTPLPDSGVPAPDAGNPSGTVNVGGACTTDGECNQSAGGFCLNQMPFAGGYCSVECNVNACPTGSSCWNLGLPQPVCLDDCASNTDCRIGYICDADNTCWPGTPPNPTGGEPIGGACSTATDCADPGAYCVTQAGWPGGYCTTFDCATSGCPSGSSCYQLANNDTACFASCSGPSQCRTPDYACDASGGCFPGCGATGCSSGEVCNSTTGLCELQACTPGSCPGGTVCDGVSGRCVVDLGSPPSGPIPSCPNVPNWQCNVAGCSDIVAFEPVTGPGYDNYPLNGETYANQYRSFIRRDVMMLVKYAAASVDCLSAGWNTGNGAPAGLGDMSEASGAIPGTSIGQPGHPAGTHENGTDMDIGYFQIYGSDNHLRPICPYTINGADQSHCVAPPDNLDVWRTALFLGKMHETSGLRVIGVDGQVGPLVESAITQLCARGWLTNSVCTYPKVTYETTNQGRGWYYFHHHHFHISVSSSGTLLAIPPSEQCLNMSCDAPAHDLVPLSWQDRLDIIRKTPYVH